MAKSPTMKMAVQNRRQLYELLTYLEANEDDPDFQRPNDLYSEQYLGGESSVDFNNYELDNLRNFNSPPGRLGYLESQCRSCGYHGFCRCPAHDRLQHQSVAWFPTLNNINISGVGGGTGYLYRRKHYVDGRGCDHVPERSQPDAERCDH
jgi:hypothetical protein